MGKEESVGTFEAKTKFSELLERVGQGAEIVITKHEKPIARLVPYGRLGFMSIDSLFQRFAEFPAKHAINTKRKHRSYRELIEEGRKR